MSNIFEIKLKRTKNLGNYESKTVEATMQLEENEDQELAMVKLAEFVNNSLNEVKPKHIKEVVDGGNVLTLNKEVKDPSSGKKVTKKKATKKKATKGEVPPVIETPATKEDITLGLQKVWKNKGKEIAKDILKSFEVSKIGDLKEDHYSAVIKEILKCLK